MRALLLAAALAAAAPAAAHDGHAHPPPPPDALPFPVAIRADFALTDQHGAERRPADFAAGPWLLLFGYARCAAICAVALPRMAEAVDLLAAQGLDVTPVLVTVDPASDTPAALSEAAPAIHPRLVALTGSQAALAAARAAFQVESRVVLHEPDGAPVYAHGSFVYLMAPDGTVAAVMPPILAPERMAEIVAAHAARLAAR